MVNTFGNFVLLGIFTLAVLSGLLGLSGCNTGISDKSLSYISPADAAVSMREGSSSLIGPERKTVLVDPRQSWAYQKTYIPSSMNIPYGQLKTQLWRLDEVGMIIVCGTTYDDSVAIAMSKTLLAMGYKDVRTVRGGLRAWEKAGEPVITEE
jgi:rhodanese-related sulfurtransferase